MTPSVYGLLMVIPTIGLPLVGIVLILIRVRGTARLLGVLGLGLSIATTVLTTVGQSLLARAFDLDRDGFLAISLVSGFLHLMATCLLIAAVLAGRSAPATAPSTFTGGSPQPYGPPTPYGPQDPPPGWTNPAS